MATRSSVPAALARLHRRAAVGEAVATELGSGPVTSWAAGGDPHLALVDAAEGAGFVDIAVHARPPPPPGEVPTGRGATGGLWTLRATRARSLPDTVAAGMRLLFCGLNPSLYAADAGVAFARPGNRFWPALQRAGVTGGERDPELLLRRDRIGMTDLVKRATVAAAELDPAEYRHGLGRVERLCHRCRTSVVCFVGLSGWRAAAEPKALAGWQERRLGTAAVYVMPSTSGLNAHARPEDLAAHVRCAAAGPP